MPKYKFFDLRHFCLFGGHFITISDNSGLKRKKMGFMGQDGRVGEKAKWRNGERAKWRDGRMGEMANVQ